MTDQQLDLDGLERLAKAATPGPWDYHEDGRYDSVLAELSNQIVHVPSNRHDTREQQAADDAAYIAAANPATVLALITAAREAEALRGAVVLAKETFHRYAQMHWSKGTADGEAKAIANADLAAKMDRALSTQAEGAADR